MSNFDIPTGFSGEARSNNNTGLKITDGDTVQVNQSIRMLNIDTPEKAGGSFGNANSAQIKLDRAKSRLEAGRFDGVVTAELKSHLLSRLTSDAAKRHFKAGDLATKALVRSMRQRVGSFTDNLQPRLFIRSYQPYFDKYSRILAFAAPYYLKSELPPIGSPERRTFNLEMLENGHAAHFPIYPSIPKAQDWNLAVNAAKDAWEEKRGQWEDDSGGSDVLLAYEFRAVLDLAAPLLKAKRSGSSTKNWFEDDIDEGLSQRATLEANGWEFSEASYADMIADAFSRHCIDISKWTNVGVQEYHTVEPWARLWVWPVDITEAKVALGVTG